MDQRLVRAAKRLNFSSYALAHLDPLLHRSELPLLGGSSLLMMVVVVVLLGSGDGKADDEEQKVENTGRDGHGSFPEDRMIFSSIIFCIYSTPSSASSTPATPRPEVFQPEGSEERKRERERAQEHEYEQLNSDKNKLREPGSCVAFIDNSNARKRRQLENKKTKWGRFFWNNCSLYRCPRPGGILVTRTGAGA